MQKHVLLLLLAVISIGNVASELVPDNSESTEISDLEAQLDTLQQAYDARILALDRRIRGLQHHLQALRPQVADPEVRDASRELSQFPTDSDMVLALQNDNSTVVFGKSEDAKISRSGPATLTVKNNLNVLGTLNVAKLNAPALVALKATVAAITEANTQLGTQNNPATSCYALKQALPATVDGVYWIDPNGGDANDSFQVFCEMTTDGGGWTFVAHVDPVPGAGSGNSIFGSNVGTYKPSRAKDGTTYSLAGSLMTQMAHTQMMITIDTASATAAAAANKIIFYQYTAGHTAFTNGPVTCRALNTGFKYRMATSGSFTTGSTSSSCDGTTFYPLSSSGAYLGLLGSGSIGMYWGTGMNGDNSWGHDGWVYVRSVANDSAPGMSQASAAADCGVLRAAQPTYPSGSYYIDPNGGSAFDAFLAYCDMTTDGGGWTLLAHADGSVSTATAHFNANMGAYRVDRFDDGTTYSRGGSLFGYLKHTQMMIAVDMPDPVTAMANQRLIFYQYPAGHPGFTTGPVVCNGLANSFSFRLALSGIFTPNGTTNECSSGAWYPRLPGNVDYLALYGSNGGTYWGIGMGGDNTWGHDSWIYVRNVNYHPSGATLGMSQATPAASCKALLTAQPATPSGIYWIDPNGGSTADAWIAYCDMVTDGGGWTFVAKSQSSVIIGNLFGVDQGTYRADRVDGAVYSRSSNMMSVVQHTQMMVSIDNPEPAITAPVNKLVIYQYTAGNPLFLTTSATCNNPSFDYKFAPGGAFQSSTSFACSASRWYPLNVYGNYLALHGVATGEIGTYWGTGMGGDGSWGHSAWFYVREQDRPTGLGFDRSSAAKDCLALKTAAPSLPDGGYWIDPNGGSNSDAYVAYCDMTTDGGGWTFAAYTSGSYTGSTLFAAEVGQYTHGRTPYGNAYNRVANLLAAISHTQMMLLLDTPDPVIAANNNKLVMYQYAAKATAFNTGPIPCSGLTAAVYTYRTKASGVWNAPQYNPSCTATEWYPIGNANGGSWLALYYSGTASYGTYWGGSVPGDNSWNHASWVYVRAAAPVTSGLGLVQTSPAASCLALLQACPTCGNGNYWIDPNGGSSSDAFITYCDMTTDGGGWTFWAHVNNDYAGGTLFSGNVGTYNHYMSDNGGTYNKHTNLYGTMAHTQAMVVLDSHLANVAMSNKKVVFYTYPAGFAGFNTGPVPCSSLTSNVWGYRVNSNAGVYQTGLSNVCDGTAWYTRTSTNAQYLTLFNKGAAYGNYWGAGLGGDDSWYHDGWWYIRESTPPTSGLGWVQSSPALSCAALKAAFPATADGQYWLDPNGGSTSDAFVAYCDMTTDGGGWTFLSHVDSAPITPNIFSLNAGTYRPDRLDDGTTYSVGAKVLPYVGHTQMMFLIDTYDVGVAAAANKFIIYNYTVGQTGFNTGPFPCSGLAPFNYRLTPTGPFTPGGVSAGGFCNSVQWYPRATGSYLALLYANAVNYGVYWGPSMGGTGSWNHDGWIFVR